MPKEHTWCSSKYRQEHAYRSHSDRRSCPNRSSPPSSSSSRPTKIGEIDDFCIRNAWIWGQILRPSLCTNFMSCSRSVCYYYNKYGIRIKFQCKLPSTILHRILVARCHPLQFQLLGADITSMETTSQFLIICWMFWWIYATQLPRS